jgi:endonuclease/exonuclease/phosphatase family metal-dependent hydrolase
MTCAARIDRSLSLGPDRPGIGNLFANVADVQRQSGPLRRSGDIAWRRSRSGGGEGSNAIALATEQQGVHVTFGRNRGVRAIGLAAGLSVLLVPVVATARPAVLPRAAALSRPTRLAVVTSGKGAALEWRSGPATGFGIERATNKAMTRGLVHYVIRGPGHQFTPYGLTKGRTYFFRVRSVRGHRHSAYTAVVQLTDRGLEQQVEAMTYNVLELSNDGRSEGNQLIAPWATRAPKAAALINQAHPDVVAVEEAASWADQSIGERQIDSLLLAVGGSYRLARTEIPPTDPHYYRTGVYILYNSATFKPVGAGNHIGLGQNRWAAYQEFANVTTGARFLFVATHLLVGNGHADDLTREAETKLMVTDGASLARHRHIPVIYAGDFNSASTKDRKFTVDGAGVAMRQAGAADALSAAQHLTHGSYDSANEYFRRPPHSSDSIDHIFAPPGVAVRTAGVVVDLVHGRFVGVIPSDHNPVIAGLSYSY